MKEPGAFSLQISAVSCKLPLTFAPFLFIVVPMPKKKKTKFSQKIESALKIKFRNSDLIEAAFTHPSFLFEHGVDKPLEDFDRLEFFGDTILNFIICERLYQLFPQEKEGMMSRLRSILVSRRMLSRVAKTLGLWKWIRLGKNLRKQGEFSKDKILADTFEAFLAAFYFQSGIKPVQKFLLQHFEPYFDIKRLFRIDPNPKSTLQELCQKKWQKLPLYENVYKQNLVKTVVSVSKRIRAAATGKNRKESEEKAARTLLKKLR
ncbi:MAG: ribonuclease III [Candidatus Omnitrophica bacterium]|nr:ribonuclease III [Candidatus Omnitrophota bacterium]